MKLTEYKNIKKPIEYFNTISNENYLVFFPFTDYYILLEKEFNGTVKYYLKFYLKSCSEKLIPIVNEKKDLSIFSKMTLDDDYENTENINICEMMDLSFINFAYMFSLFKNRENVIQKFEKKYLLEIIESSYFNKEFQDEQYLEMKEKINDKSFAFENFNDKDILEFLGESVDDMYDVRENNLIPVGDHPFQCVEPNGNILMCDTGRSMSEPLTDEEISMDLQLEKEAESESTVSYTTLSREVLHERNVNVVRKNIMKKYSTIDNITDLLIVVEDECALNIMVEKNINEWDARRYVLDDPKIRHSLFHERAQEYLMEDC
jgi:hypothetical protein